MLSRAVMMTPKKAAGARAAQVFQMFALCCILMPLNASSTTSFPTTR
jgi:hypothetical protein